MNDRIFLDDDFYHIFLVSFTHLMVSVQHWCFPPIYLASWNFATCYLDKSLEPVTLNYCYCSVAFCIIILTNYLIVDLAFNYLFFISMLSMTTQANIILSNYLGREIFASNPFDSELQP
jgi:hypothetical protein